MHLNFPFYEVFANLLSLNKLKLSLTNTYNMVHIRKVTSFFIEGFKGMTVGKKLWLIIIVKLFIIFAVLKIFFFKDFLNRKFDTQKDKGNYVIQELTKGVK